MDTLGAALALFIGAGALLLLIPAAVLLLEVVAGARASRAPPPPDARESAPCCAVLVPAHDEESTIAACVAGILPQLRSRDRLLVVADNCSDQTAERARLAGAEVSIRHDPDRRGKGFALAHGVQTLASRHPDVLIVVDADCELSRHCVSTLVHGVASTGRPVQALYRMTVADGAPLGQRLAGFAWAVKTQLRAVGSTRLGAPCELLGSGMAFPWHTIADAPFAGGHLVEDVQLGIDLAVRGHPAALCTRAAVTSAFPVTEAARSSQHARWEHGQISVMLKEVPRLIRAAASQRRAGLLLLALHVCVPPLALLALLCLIVFFAAAALAFVSGTAAPLALAALACMLCVVAIACAWRAVGRRFVSWSDLLGVPSYVIAKLPLYARYFTSRRETEWVRTARETEDRRP
jgi:hypothetical protein